VKNDDDLLKVGARSDAAMIIDAHVYIGESINGYSLSLERLFESMDELGIHRAVICPVLPRNYHLEPENDKIGDAVAQNRERVFGFCRVDPRQEEGALKELERAYKLGLRGLLLHPWEEGYRVNGKQSVRLATLAAEMAMPILVEAGYPWVSNALQVADLCHEVPQATVMMSHGGQINISGFAQPDAFAALANHSNLLIHTSGVYRQDFLEEVIEKFGAERVVFGSSFPVMDQCYELKRVQNLKLKVEDKAKIEAGNILRLIG
jgi:predicted TIM-barrel fold metal-dependent hydrolase